jgi:hypothetical protein
MVSGGPGKYCFIYWKPEDRYKSMSKFGILVILLGYRIAIANRAEKVKQGYCVSRIAKWR